MILTKLVILKIREEETEVGAVKKKRESHVNFSSSSFYFLFL